MKTILVTGAAGFIGSHVCEKLLGKGFRVIAIDNFDSFYEIKLKTENLKNCYNHKNFQFYDMDLMNMENLNHLHFDAIIHLAAKTGVRPSLKNPQGYIQTNIVGTQKVLDFAKNNQITNIIFASSSSVYGNNKTPFHETDSVDHPISVYAYTKKCGELMLSTYHHLYGINFMALRFFTVYGPRQRPDLAINSFTTSILNNETIEVFGNGQTTRDYTYISDIVNGVFKSLEYLFNNDNVAEILNLGSNNPIILNDLIEKLYKHLKKENRIEYKEMQSGDVTDTYADITKAKQLIGYEPKVSFDEGICNYLKSIGVNN